MEKPSRKGIKNRSEYCARSQAFGDRIRGPRQSGEFIYTLQRIPGGFSVLGRGRRMSNNTARRLLSFLIVALMVLSGVVVLAGATARAAPVSVAQADQSSQGPSPETTAGATTSTDKIGQPPSLALWKIDSALQSVALSGDKGWSYVEIRSVAGAELGRLLTSYGARVSSDLALEGRPIGPITFRNVATDNLPVIQRVWIPNAALSSISALPSTISVSLPLVPKLDSSQQGPTTPLGEDRIDRTAIAHALQEQGIELTNFPSYLEHGSLAARQDYGVTGSGASIAIVDTPVDFGQANLVGQWAVNQNASSPYFGWPIVGDTGSLSDNLALWTTSSDLDRFPYPLLSSRGTFNSNFLSDTHYEAAVNATGRVRNGLCRPELRQPIHRREPGEPGVPLAVPRSRCGWPAGHQRGSRLLHRKFDTGIQ